MLVHRRIGVKVVLGTSCKLLCVFANVGPLSHVSSHTNALDKFTDGHYLLSGRHTDTVYKIDKNDGHIIWRAGGRKTDFDMGAANFSRQHHARFHSQNETHTIISVFDNAKGADKQSPSSEHSSGKVIALNTETMTADLLKHYDHPQDKYAYRRGNFQILPNSNAFLCWSEQSLQSEHKEDGTIIMEARMLPDWIGTYRGFKYEFVGLPNQPPDVNSSAIGHGHTENSTKTLVHVSWNGATEVKSWKLHKTTEKGATEVELTSAEKDGFETAIEYEGFAAFVVVEGIGKNGASLGKSKIVKTELAAHMSEDESPDVKEEMQWQKQAEIVNQRPSSGSEESKMTLFNRPIPTLVAFVAGLVFSPILVYILYRWRQRRLGRAWHQGRGPSYAPLSEGDAAEYDETKLDDLSSDGRQKSEDSEQYGLTGDDSDDENGDSDVGRSNGRTTYLRQGTGA